MITNKSRKLYDSPDGPWMAGFIFGVLGLIFGTVGLFVPPHWLALTLIFPAVFLIMLFFALTNAYDVLNEPHESLLRSYETAPEQVKKDLGYLSVKQIQSMSANDVRRVSSAISDLTTAYFEHQSTIPDSRVEVLLDNAQTATKAYKELAQSSSD